MLAQVSFAGHDGGPICFGTDNSCASASPNVISSASGVCIDAGWGPCHEGGLARGSASSELTLEVQNVDVQIF